MATPDPQMLSQLYTLDGRVVEETIVASPLAHAQSPSSRMEGAVVDGKYKIISLLGEGGMGAVYRAHHLMLNKDVAFKTFRSSNLDSQAWERFRREAQAIGRINHQNIVQVFDFGLGENNLPYYTMECLSGQTLADLLADCGRLPLDLAIEMFVQVCDGLTVAHGKGIVHRDLKPSNIFLMNDGPKRSSVGTVKIVDFGLAGLALQSVDGQKLTSTGTVFGSPLYMSPEQSLGQVADKRSDIYSCGCALFEVITGKTPFRGENAFATMLMHQQNPVPRLSEFLEGMDVSQRLQGLLDSMLAKQASQRIGSFAEVRSELDLIRQGSSSVQTASGAKKNQTEPSLPGQGEEEKRAKNFLAIHKLWIAALVVILLSGLIVNELLKGETNRKSGVVVSVSQGQATGPEVSTGIKSGQPVAPDVPYEGGLFFQRQDHWNRYFLFPKESIGTLELIVPPNAKVLKPPKTLTAQGKVEVSNDYVIHFIAEKAVAEDPTLLSYFRPNDLGHLKFKSDDLRYSFADKHMAAASKLTGLVSLDISDCKITKASLPFITKLTGLSEIDAGGTDIDGTELISLPQLSTLYALGAKHMQNIRPVLEKLAQSRTVKSLRVNGCNLKDNDMKLVAQMTSLQLLDLDDNQGITDQGIATISTLPHLHTLHIVHTGITNKCIPSLKSFKELTYLTIRKEIISDADLDEIHRSRPGLEIKPNDRTESKYILEDAFGPPAK